MRRGAGGFLLLGPIVLSGGILPLYKPAGPVPVVSASQSRKPRGVDPQAQILQYYRQYPDRYIRVSKESWKYEDKSRVALHSFTLRNTATVGYCEIEISIVYQTSSEKTLHTEHVKLPDILGALRTIDVNQLKVQKVPRGAETAVVRVTKALICR